MGVGVFVYVLPGLLWFAFADFGLVGFDCCSPGLPDWFWVGWAGFGVWGVV